MEVHQAYLRVPEEWMKNFKEHEEVEHLDRVADGRVGVRNEGVADAGVAEAHGTDDVQETHEHQLK